MTDAEILRLRDKQHELEKTVWGTRELAKELARGLGELRDQVHELEELVEAMTQAEKIAAAVTGAIRSDRRARWSFSRVLAGAAGGLILMVPALHELVVWAGL